MATRVQSERRRFQLFSLTGALLVLAILATANFVLSVAPVRVDTSAGGAYSVSRATKSVLDKLDDTLIVRVVFSRELPAVYKLNERYVTDLLSEYRRASHGKIRVEYFDPGASPKSRELAIDYGIVPVQLDVMERDRHEVAERFMGIAFFYGDRSEAVPFVQDVQNLEYEITVRIKKLIDPTKPVIGFVGNSGASGPGFGKSFEPMKKPLEDLYEIRPVDASQPIPKEIRALWWLGPVDASSAAVTANLAQFVRDGGSIGLMVDTHMVNVGQFRTASIPFEWNDVLSEWGISVRKGFVVDSRCDRIQIRAVQGAYQMINVVDYPYFPLVTALDRGHPAARGIDGITMPFVAALEYKGAKEGIKYTALADSSADSYLEEFPFMVSPIDDRIKPPDAPTGPFHLAVLAEGKFGPSAIGRVAVFATSRFVRAEFPMRPSNYAYFFNFTDWLAQDEVLLSIRSKGFSRRPLRQLSDGARSFIKVASATVMPVLTLLLGLVSWRFQRSRRAAVARDYRETSA